MAATTVIVALAWACSDNGGGGTGPGAPTAAFNAPTNCTATVACQFTDASTGSPTGWSWTFGDDANAAPTTDQNPSHTYAAAGNYDVALTVTNANGTSQPVTHTVTVAGPANPAPTASFSVPPCGVAVSCTFTSTSTDVAPGTIQTTHWNFGDAGSANNEVDGTPVQHTYGAAGDYTVTLTVTDDGGATGTTSQTVHVLAAAAQDCATTGGTVLCTLTVPSAAAASSMTLTMVSRDCELSGNRVSVREPAQQDIWGNICVRPVQPPVTVTGPFAAGSAFHVQFTQGTADQGDPAPGAPKARVEGNGPDWTLTIDDGGNPTAQNEPDFNDVILTVHANP